MQSPAAAIRGSHAAANAAVIGLKTFTRRSKMLSEFTQVQANTSLTPTHDPGAPAGEDGSKRASRVVVDGKLNYPVRKRRPTTVAKKADETETPAPNPPLLSIAKDLPSNASSSEVEASAVVVVGDGAVGDGSSSVVASTVSGTKTRVRRESARLKRAAEVQQTSGGTELSDNSPRTARRVSRKNAVVAKPQARKAEMGLPAPTASNAAATDFWQSSISEPQNSGGTIVKELVEAAIPPIMSSKRLSAAEAIPVALQHLKSACPLLKAIIEMHHPPKFENFELRESAFTALARSIVFQQLATKAATSIFGRLVTLCEGLDKLTPTTISQLSAEQMRAVGISGRKASYLHDLAANFLSGALSDSTIYDMDDESLMKALTAVKGIGVWSVHMFMLFTLHRPDVLPVSDLGVRKGLQKLYSLKELPNPAQAEKITFRWQPYRSVGSWYMWRVISSTPIKPVISD